jgi:thioredoxin 1
MTVKQVTAQAFERDVLESGTPVVVDFYADWCGPCRALAPEIERLAGKWDGRVTFAKLDVDRAAEIAQRYRVVSIPTVLLFQDGEVRASSRGLKTGEALERELGLSDRPRDGVTDQHPHECAC